MSPIIVVTSMVLFLVGAVLFLVATVLDFRKTRDKNFNYYIKMGALTAIVVSSTVAGSYLLTTFILVMMVLFSLARWYNKD